MLYENSWLGLEVEERGSLPDPHLPTAPRLLPDSRDVHL